MSFLAVGVSAGVAVAGTVASSAIQAGAAKKAGKQQAKSADAALELQREQYEQQRADLAPWRQAGGRALGQLERFAQQGPPQMAPWQAPQALDPRGFAFKPPPGFKAPTAADLARDPSYQFRLQEGQRALERGASARGGLLSGGFARGLERYAQDYASTEYGQVYGRKQQEYGQRYQEAAQQNQLRYGRALTQNEQAYERALQQYQTRYNVGQQAWQNRLAPWQALTGLGGNAANQTAQLSSQYANQAGDLLTGQGNALAAGTLAAGQAYAQIPAAIGGAVNQGLQGYYLGQQMRPPSTPQPGYAPTGGSRGYQYGPPDAPFV